MLFAARIYFYECLCVFVYCKNSNIICMILTKIRGMVEGLRIIQVNKKTHNFPVFRFSVSSDT